MFDALTLLYLCLSIGFLAISIAIVLLIKRLFKTLDNLDVVITDFRNTSDQIKTIKNKASGTFFTLASMALGLFFKKRKGGGE